jgi:antitoxin component of MazEF toxin-antitoxin module
MRFIAKLIRVGGSQGLIIPKEFITQVGMKKGCSYTFELIETEAQ